MLKIGIIERIENYDSEKPFNKRYALDSYFKDIADELDITIMMNGSTPNPIKYNVELNVYQCYRNYYEYIYDSNGNFTKIINDIANDNFKKISW